MLDGGADNDHLYGGDDDDKLFGAQGDDTLEGGKGRTEAFGGVGNDTYIYNEGDGPLVIKDVSGNVLPPEVGVNQEVGLKTEFFDGKLNSWLAFFRIDHSNLAELDPNAPPFSCNGADCYRATGLVISEGIDVGLAGALSKNWNIFGGYTYLHQTYANGELKGERFRPQLPVGRHQRSLAHSSSLLRGMVMRRPACRCRD